MILFAAPLLSADFVSDASARASSLSAPAPPRPAGGALPPAMAPQAGPALRGDPAWNRRNTDKW